MLTDGQQGGTLILTTGQHRGGELMPLKLYEKEEILDACFHVFAHYGYAKTSTAMLAEAAGISKALLLHHFKNKKKLFSKKPKNWET